MVKKYGIWGVLILACFIAACSVSSPVKKLTVPLPCYKEIQSLKNGWKEADKHDYYEIDTTKFPTEERFQWCYSKLSTANFQSVFGKASKTTKLHGAQRLWYVITSTDKHPSKVEAFFKRDTLVQMLYHNCQGTENRLKNKFNYEPEKGHYISSLGIAEPQEIGYCLMGSDSALIKSVIGKPSHRNNTNSKWSHVTRPFSKGGKIESIPRLEVTFDEGGKLESMSFQLAMIPSH